MVEERLFSALCRDGSQETRLLPRGALTTTSIYQDTGKFRQRRWKVKDDAKAEKICWIVTSRFEGGPATSATPVVPMDCCLVLGGCRRGFVSYSMTRFA